MIPLIGSLIKVAALKYGVSCAQVFVMAALYVNPSAAKLDDKALRVFAQEACLVEETDSIWEIAFVESRFQFVITSNNEIPVTAGKVSGNSSVPRTLKGMNALRALKKAMDSDETPNLDIGVMQLNIKWHHEWFEKKYFRMISPSQQVKYFSEVMVPSLKKHCKADWQTCYHTIATKKLKDIYRKKLKDARKVLEIAVSKKHLGKLFHPVAITDFEPII
ncbi:MAG: hypothetical protein EOP06_04200 [Proteobacteria bacterium]|nr:MAG: hypothetical protein EOP06_04200 [Pseudomonadota bacterium]